MPRGGKRAGAGLKPRLSRYRRRSSIGRRALAIGQRCEELWREADKNRWRGAKRPRERKRIIAQVAAEFGETPRMTDKLWDEYRLLERDLRADPPPV